MLHLLPDNPLKAIVNLPAVSRAFGDRLLKKYVVAEPDVLEESLTGDDTLLIMATDGLWDVVSNQDAISMVRVRLFTADRLPEGCARIAVLIMPCCVCVRTAA